MDPQSFTVAIHELGLSSFEDELRRVALPCLNILTEKAGTPVPSSESKIGGMPDLPAGVEWPHAPAGDAVPMLFLGRIAAQDVARIYPTLKAHLLFFAEWIYDREGLVLAVPPDVETFPATCPPRPGDAHPSLVECHVTVTEGISLPDYQNGPERELYSKELLHFGEKPDPFWGKKLMHPLLRELFWRSSCNPGPAQGLFRFGGYPIYVQAHPIENANLNPDTAGITDWCSLMSFGDDEASELSYGDTGFCGFMTTRRAIGSGELSFLHFYQDSM